MSERKHVTIIRDPKGNIIGQATNVEIHADGFAAEEISMGELGPELEEGE